MEKKKDRLNKMVLKPHVHFYIERTGSNKTPQRHIH